jgi:hypothetical protein
MKAAEFSSLMKMGSKILDLFGDMQVHDVLDKLYYFAKTGMAESNYRHSKISNKIPVDLSSVVDEKLIELMSNMNSQELAFFMKTSEILSTKVSLLYLANKLSITSSERQNIETLRHYIVNYFEKNRIHDIIKNERF